jgi:hypothetical protein
MNATSSQDEFAKWAKLRRQHDKVLEQLEKSSTVPQIVYVFKDYTLTRHCRILNRLHESYLRQRDIYITMAGHKWSTDVSTILVFEASYVLDPEGLGTILR